MSLGVSPAAQAALKCEEMMASRSCTDNAPKAYQVAPGQSVMIPAPTIAGYPSPCWNWNRRFQCVESTPIYSCESGTPYDTVKQNCSLTAATTHATIKINAITYITDASYTYRCAFGDYIPDTTLPPNRECVMLDSTVQNTKTTPTLPSGSIVTEQKKTDEYVCYSPPQTVCSNICYKQVVNPSTGKLEQKEVACTSPVTNCVSSSSQCEGSASVSGSNSSGSASWGPDGRCVSSTEVSTCQGGSIPRCLTQDNCVLDSTTPVGVQDNGFATSQEQSYICSNNTTTCTKYTTLSSCVSPNAWDWDKLSLSGEVGLGLGEFNQAMSKAEGIEKGLKENDPYIFSGEDLRCRYPVGNFLNTFISIALVAVSFYTFGTTGFLAQGLYTYGGMSLAAANAVGAAVTVGASFAQDAPTSKAFGSNCCKDYVIEGSDKWYKLGSCTADEVKLAVARRKGLAHYLGTYCSKKSGFPVKQCVEKTKSYCVFDDMLAYVVNEQGRAQLDQLASADASTTTRTADLSFQLFAGYDANATKYGGALNNGRWLPVTTHANSQVWVWQYPGYCQSSVTQATAYDKYMAELNALVDIKGIQPAEMTEKQAVELIVKTLGAPEFQECADTPGMVAFMTCSKTDDSCDVNKLPSGPGGVDFDISGIEISEADVNWRIQQVRSFYNPGDYGVTAVMTTNSAYAAVSNSLSAFITATGSCKTTGACLYNFAVTDKQATGGWGARKRVEDYAQFPLYTVMQNSAWPSMDYLGATGSFSTATWNNDPNRGLGTPLVVSNQRFVFRPNFAANPTGPLHTHVLLEWATEKLSASKPEDDYSALLVPTTLPPASPGWYPHGSASDPTKRFYLTGGCDPGSRWCEYKVEIDLNIARHPWGTAKSPRCWGFSLEQMAALDFNKMDLSKWINSLDLGSVSANMSEEAAAQMGERVATSAQSFYTAFQSGSAVNNPNPGTVALVTNTDILPKLSSDNYKAYTLEVAVPANWPNWFDDQPNNNPVTNVRVDWGDGSPVQSLSKASTNRAFYGEHDYGDRPVGTYKVMVTLDTANNGPQTLSTHVSITPNSGKMPSKETKLDFANTGTSGQAMGEYTPAMMPDGSMQSPAALESLAPGMTELFKQQGNTVGEGSK